jgi:hypothetical protein
MEEHRLMVYMDGVLMRIFLYDVEDITGESRNLHNDKHHNLYSSLNIIGIIK